MQTLDLSVFQYKYTMSILMYLHNIVKIADDLTHVTTYLKINYLFCQLVSLLCMFKMSIVYTVYTIHALSSCSLNLYVLYSRNIYCCS